MTLLLSEERPSTGIVPYAHSTRECSNLSCSEAMLLPLVNPQRVGMCGYAR